jgi:hypothetical protein
MPIDCECICIWFCLFIILIDKLVVCPCDRTINYSGSGAHLYNNTYFRLVSSPNFNVYMFIYKRRAFKDVYIAYIVYSLTLFCSLIKGSLVYKKKKNSVVYSPQANYTKNLIFFNSKITLFKAWAFADKGDSVWWNLFKNGFESERVWNWVHSASWG